MTAPLFHITLQSSLRCYHRELCFFLLLYRQKVIACACHYQATCVRRRQIFHPVSVRLLCLSLHFAPFPRQTPLPDRGAACDSAGCEHAVSQATAWAVDDSLFDHISHIISLYVFPLQTGANCHAVDYRFLSVLRHLPAGRVSVKLFDVLVQCNPYAL